MLTGNFWLSFGMVAVSSYLLGSFNFAIIISKAAAQGDVRAHGSGNAGMTNMLRTYGTGKAALTALGDFLKAIAAVLLARLVFAGDAFGAIEAGYLAGFFVLLGHLFPLYFGFKGGKGVITTLGIALILNPIVFLILIAVFLPLVFITRIVSLGSILGAICYPALTFALRSLQGRPALFETLCAVVLAGIIICMHRSNIKRLLSGTENRFERKGKS